MKMTLAKHESLWMKKIDTFTNNQPLFCHFIEWHWNPENVPICTSKGLISFWLKREIFDPITSIKTSCECYSVLFYSCQSPAWFAFHVRSCINNYYASSIFHQKKEAKTPLPWTKRSQAFVLSIRLLNCFVYTTFSFTVNTIHFKDVSDKSRGLN